MTTYEEFNAEPVECAADGCTDPSDMLVEEVAWCIEHLPLHDPKRVEDIIRSLVMTVATQGHEIVELREAVVGIGKHNQTHCGQINAVISNVSALQVAVPNVGTAQEVS